ncbi:MAG: hypothetical protein AAGA56_13825 [Myxococcota bacterium]
MSRHRRIRHPHDGPSPLLGPLLPRRQPPCSPKPGAPVGRGRPSSAPLIPYDGDDDPEVSVVVTAYDCLR